MRTLTLYKEVHPMIFPGGEIDYKAIVDSFIEDKAFSSIIWENMDFVEKYLPKIEETFANESEKRIVYRELAVVAYSCIEAIMKGVLYNINDHCEHRKCDKKCEYRKCTDIKSLNQLHAFDVFHFLLDTRMVWFFPHEIYEFDILNDLRNNIHLSKSIGIEKKPIEFDEDFAKRMVNYFYGLLAQLSFKESYFKDDSTCLKESDNNQVKKTRKENEKEITKSKYHSIAAALNLLFLGVDLHRNEQWSLANLHKKVPAKDIAASIYFIFAMSARRFQTDDDYQRVLDGYFNRLEKYLPEDYLNNVISSYNEISNRYGDKR